METVSLFYCGNTIDVSLEPAFFQQEVHAAFNLGTPVIALCDSKGFYPISTVFQFPHLFTSHTFQFIFRTEESDGEQDSDSSQQFQELPDLQTLRKFRSFAEVNLRRYLTLFSDRKDHVTDNLFKTEAFANETPEFISILKKLICILQDQYVHVTFPDMLLILVLLSQETLKSKLELLFDIYDNNHEDVLSLDQLFRLFSTYFLILEALSPGVWPPEHSPEELGWATALQLCTKTKVVVTIAKPQFLQWFLQSTDQDGVNWAMVEMPQDESDRPKVKMLCF